MANIALRAVFVLLLCSSLRCYARFTSRAAILLRISPPMHIVCFIRPNFCNK
uniref:Secreted protein n=1 Tax=Ascaris lumbricoides TaxID=6252 RepID=A0A0M3HKP0_ASCLU